MTPPEHPHAGVFSKHYSRADSLQPLRNPAHINMRPVRDQNVNVVAGYLTGQDRYLVFMCDLPDEVAHTNRDISRQYLPSIFWNPNQMYLQIVVRVRAHLVSFHGTTFTRSYSSPARRGVSIIPRGDTKAITVR